MDLLRREANPRTLDRNGAGGVSGAVKDIWCSLGSVKLIPSNEKFLSSHCVCVNLHPPHSDPLLICGTYMPFDCAHKETIYAQLQNEMQAYQTPVLAGDWNAALYTTNRPLQEDALLINKPSRMALDNMHGDLQSSQSRQAYTPLTLGRVSRGVQSKDTQI